MLISSFTGILYPNATCNALVGSLGADKWQLRYQVTVMSAKCYSGAELMSSDVQ
ncbi:unnamed protein product, partial [Dovyalis caffra]